MPRLLPIGVLFLLFSAVSGAEDPAISLVGPDSMEPGQYAQYIVTPLPTADLPKARVSCWPRRGTMLIAAQTWGGEPFLLFSAREPGEYLLSVFACTATGGRYGEKVVVVGRPRPVEVRLEGLPEAITEGQTAQAVVRSTEPGMQLVLLSSDQPARLVTPQAAVIPEGQYSATFTFSAPDNTVVDGDQRVTIRATMMGVQAYGQILVKDNDERPKPKPTGLWCVIVEDSLRRTVRQGAIYGSQRVRSVFKGFRLIDKDVKNQRGETPSDAKPYIERAKSLPWMVLISEDGVVHWEGPLPGTPDEVIAIANSILAPTARRTQLYFCPPGGCP